MDKHLITIRRGEIDRQIGRLQEQLDALNVERGELDIAERVFDKLTGAKRSAPSEANEPRAPSVRIVAKDGRPTIRQMIMAALMDAKQRNFPGRTPQEIREFIKATYNLEIGQPINTNASRMWRDLKEIDKDEASGRFRLPSKEKATDLLFSGEQSAASIQPARDGEPVREVEHDNIVKS